MLDSELLEKLKKSRLIAGTSPIQVHFSSNMSFPGVCDEMATRVKESKAKQS